MKTRREFMRSALGGALLGPALSSMYPRILSADDEKVAKQLAKLDAEFVKALTELAKKYDKDQVPEAAHFFASVALGLGAKDEALNPVKASYEASVYLGRLRGGEPLKETASITSALGGVSTSYKKILDPWIKSARKGELSEATRKLMLETGVKYELSRGAHEYVQAVQRFNALRKPMGLRGILWDYEESRKMILAGWYTCETEDWELKEPKKESAFYTDNVKAAERAGRGANKLFELPEALRSFALVRQDLLNPNARTLWLGFWGGGSRIDYWGLYAIPQLPFRQDIPTPSQRFRGETIVKDWVDVEETTEIGGKKVPLVKYPYHQENEVPVFFSNGKGYMEMGWAKSEYDTLEHGGIPIMLRVFTEETPKDIVASLVDKGGSKRTCRVYVNGDKRVNLVGEWATIVLLPEKQLDGLTEYSVTIKCTIGESHLEKSWTFKTRSK